MWHYVFILLANNWIWKVFSQNFLIFIAIIFESIILSLIFFKKLSKKWLILFWVMFFLIIFLQIKTSLPQSLTLLDNDEQRIKQERLKFYNPSNHYLRVIFYRLDLRDHLEGDFNIATFRILRNFFETIDPNVYFFAGHPRERVWANDFKKFPFILILPFLLGIYKLFSSKNMLVYLYLGISILILSFIGHKNILGSFILFPVIILTIFVGINSLIKLIPKRLYKPMIFILICLILIDIF